MIKKSLWDSRFHT